MARIARVVAVGFPHHITQRGNNRADVFFDDQDRRRYLNLLVKYAEEFKLDIWAYCLMTNHIHILAVPQQNYSLAQGIGRANLVYTQYVNARYRRSGRLWQNRFFSCPVEAESYLWVVARYIETNPVRAKIVTTACEYPWSSARCHVEGTPDLVVGKSQWLDPRERSTYREFLLGDASADVSLIRHRTAQGRPVGSAGFIAQLAATLNRILEPRPRGRPRVGES
jgi:putative transposase